jgi:phosphoesterase RecJ-like protein
MTTESAEPPAGARLVADAIARGRRFVLSSHARPDGDAIGSQLAMAFALDALGKEVTIVNRDPVPGPLAAFPGTARIVVADRVDETFDAAIIMECSSLDRTGVSGLERSPVINVDHHQGNTAYGAVNWFDPAAAACAEMVFDVIVELGVPMSREIATHLYVGILTDTGSFHYSGTSARTFDIARRLVEAGVEPATVARTVFDSNTLGRLKLFGAVLSAIELEHGGRLAVMNVDHAMARAAGGTYDDTEGLINLPLTAREIQAVVFFKVTDTGDVRVSMRSKYEVDVRRVASEFGGGGHKNASGFTVSGPLSAVRDRIVNRIVVAIAQGLESRP